MNARLVYVIDDEPELRRALARLLMAEGLRVEAIPSALEFLSAMDTRESGCVLLDVAMPGLDGLGLQQRLVAQSERFPIVFLTGHGDIPMSVRAVKAGAVDFLTKPVRREDLLRAVTAAFDRIAEWELALAARAELLGRLGRLTPREREVIEHVIAGRLNKLIAARLGTAEHTVKIHRARAMQKLGARSIPELVRIADQVGLRPSA
jgi:FixJ family two-component response regulator